ncbi:PPOX class F420-dependent oxidoreductase [Streptomyces mirabilis]|uniref:PPOX class F420-dependent oxidoreductase n=1 Tax=Streptomyces mirabilis TaxID=68239 RepID=UPI0022590372|nr:PPOX class F420-dependent oxidoreductase [Streptomyces mirabilis]MCX4428529.1 PPOX class F420-dependent oxidoreductase [Streptomyces mirabilis]
MPFTPTPAEAEYLATQPLGRLATVQRNGTVQVTPVRFVYNAPTASIDIGGYNLVASQKYRNVMDNGRAAIVIDDISSLDPWRIRCLEIRGIAQIVPDTGDSPINKYIESEGPFIRLRPSRVISLGVEDPEVPPHELVPRKRNTP